MDARQCSSENLCLVSLSHDSGKPLAAARQAEVSQDGAIKSFTLPSGWSAGDNASGGIGQRHIERFNPPLDKSVEISVYYRGLPISDPGAGAFQDILKAKPAAQRPEMLTADEVRKLQEAMGTMTIGDNQYTNPSTNPRYAPVFHVNAAYTTRLNGKTVLGVEGSFVDETGKRINDYTGYFIDRDGNGKNIQEIFYQAPPDKYPRYLLKFKDSLKNNLEWN